jgi:CHAT domain-containing protein/tetratricopeptide (TPR) repeat protein
MNARGGACLACLLALALSVRQAPAQPAAAGATDGTPLTAKQKERLQERARVFKEVSRLLQAGKGAEAVALWEKEVARDRKTFGPTHEEVAEALRVLARMHEIREDFPEGRKALREVLAIRTRLYGAKHWRVTDARWAVKSLEIRAGLGAPDRLQLTRAVALERQAVRLYQEGRPGKGVPLAKETLAVRRRLLGEGHPDSITALNNLAMLYQATGEHGQARELFEQARDLRKKALGEGHPDYAQSLNNLAGWYQNRGEYVRARALLEQARDLFKQALGESHPRYATSLNNLAGVHRSTGEYGRARDLYEQARALRKKALGERDPAYAASLNNLGGLYREMGEYERARPLLEQARALTRKTRGEDHPAYAASLNNLAALYQETGEYGRARVLFEQARALIRKTRGEDHPRYATALNNLAILYQDTGEYERARDLFEQARALARKTRGEDHPDYATPLNNLGGLYQEMGEYERARALFEQARALIKKSLGEGNPRYAISLSNLARVYQETGEYGRARALYEQARDLRKKALGESHPDYAISLSDLANLHRARGEYGPARALYERTRDLCKQALGESHPDYATSLGNLARVYRAMGEYDRARDLYEQARDLRKKILGEQHPAYATGLNNLAALYQDWGEYDRARELYEQARNLLAKALGKDHPHHATSLHNLALWHQAAGNPAEAGKLARIGLAPWTALLANTFTGQSHRARLVLVQHYKHFLDGYLTTVAGTDEPAASLYEAVLLWKGAVAARQAEERLAHDRPELQPLLAQLRLARAGLARLVNLRPGSKEEQAAWRQRFDRLEKEREDLEARLARRSAAFLREQKLRRVKAQQVCQALPPRTALVELVEYLHYLPPPQKKGPFQGEARLLALVLIKGQEPALVPLGPAEPVARAVEAWRRAVQRHADPQPAAAELQRRVWQPLHKHLRGAKAVLVAPDGALSFFPFAALPGSKPGAYLLEEVALGYVTSGRHLLELAAESEGPADGDQAAAGGLAYGAPPLAGGGGPAPRAKYAYLPGTRLEAERIARLCSQRFPGQPAPRLFGGAGLDADRLRRELPPAKGAARPRYLHLATHGFFEAPSAPAKSLRWEQPELLPFELARDLYTYTRNPLLRCGLALAGANADPEKGVLRAEEVANLDLRGCELAVLSACETALGKAADTEGVQSLQRAFQGAGARSLVVSLWKVHDAATSVLMEEFYTNLWQKKLSRLEALRQAQLTVLRNPGRVQQRQKELHAELLKRKLRGPEDEPELLPWGGAVAERRSHPALWAAFILSGDTAPVPEVNRSR